MYSTLQKSEQIVMWGRQCVDTVGVWSKKFRPYLESFAGAPPLDQEVSIYYEEGGGSKLMSGIEVTKSFYNYDF